MTSDNKVKPMKLGAWLKEYRSVHNLTMQEMADKCGFSKAYISLLEKGKNPTTGKPYSPKIQTFEKIALATNQDLSSLLEILDDDQPITVNAPANEISEEEVRLVAGYRDLDDENRNLVMNLITKLISVSHKAAAM